jgi:S1-C subfamily serine protease
VTLKKQKPYINNPKPIVMPAFTPSEAAVLSFKEHGPPPLPAKIDPAHYVAEVIAPTVTLPAGATITNVNGQAVTSVAQAANALYAASQLLGQAIVDVDTPAGRMHLYVPTPPPVAIR